MSQNGGDTKAPADINSSGGGSDNSGWKRIADALSKHKLIGPNIQQLLGDYVEIAYDEAAKLVDYQSAAHAFFWARNPNKLWNFDLRASILMQMRFDGSLGFPGGFIDATDKCWEDGLNRELAEELHLNERHRLGRADHYRTWVSHTRRLVLNFYIREVSLADYEEIENDGRRSDDFGGEVMGIVRPPLFNTSRNRGFSVFIQNQFIGNALVQLLQVVHELKILSEEEILEAIAAQVK